MLSSKDQKNIKSKFNKIYKKIYKSKDLDIYSNEIIDIIKKSNKVKKSKKKIKIDEKTALVICYADSVLETNKPHTLKAFKSFYKKYLKNCFNTVHFLPFYPSSSDSGFAVKDHYKIDKKYGNWGDINSFSKNNLIMADVVINHASSRGLWFKNYLKMKSPGRGYFFTIDNKFNTSKVVRPREHKLLKKINIFNKNEYLWRTFSPDQIDLNFKNPKVLMRFIKIIINLINHGVSIFRLDAIAYLWKQDGTKCINLQQTHLIIKLIRAVCNSINKQAIIVTETNLPEKENISYFGNSDEANWIYNFSLPPLLVYTFLFENSKKLNGWSKKLPEAKKGNSYLNFLASHDGIGMRPAEGILNKYEINNLLGRLRKNGSEFSYRKIQNKKKSVYEANITIIDALKKSNEDIKGKYFIERFVSAHAIIMAFDGVPGIYFNSVFGTSNDLSKYIISNNKRDLNRYRWNKLKLEKLLKNKKTKHKIVYDKITHLLKIRKKQKAFNPNAKRITLDLGSKFFGIKRISLDKKQFIYSITNISSKRQKLQVNHDLSKLNFLISKKFNLTDKKTILFEPSQTVWISNTK